jgi:hypothetical protein
MPISTKLNRVAFSSLMEHTYLTERAGERERGREGGRGGGVGGERERPYNSIVFTFPNDLITIISFSLVYLKKNHFGFLFLLYLQECGNREGTELKQHNYGGQV